MVVTNASFVCGSTKICLVRSMLDQTPDSCQLALHLFNIPYDGKKTSRPSGTTGQKAAIVRPSELMYFTLSLELN